MLIHVNSACPEGTIHELGIRDWPIWTCEAGIFPWTYGESETFLMLEGVVTVTAEVG